MKGTQALVAEFLGTFFLCFAGIAAILSTTSAVGSGAGIVGIALAHGLALSIAVNCFGGVSGGHCNPAVTFAMLATGRATPQTAVGYIIAQCAGATAAAFICASVFPADAVAAANLGIPLPAAWATSGVVFTLEFVMTFLLVIAVFGTAVDPRGAAVKIGGFAIGLTVTFDILAGGAVTGASMNPARSFGPALIQGFWTWHAFYWIAPIAGAITAALIYDNLILDKKA
ncbi:MAG TPA: aquaporin [Vicinamibacterales bacterium]|nr:aquaporin [Vicinamibacterales bacterium]